MKFLLLFLTLLAGCFGNDKSSTELTASQALWDRIKSNASPGLSLTSEFNSPARLSSVGTLAWEDGVYISDDGLYIFSFYAPVDLLKWVDYSNANQPCPPISSFLRGDTLPGTDFDLVAPYTTLCTGGEGVLHSEIAFSFRSTVNESFSPWARHPVSADFKFDGGFTASKRSSGNYDLVFSRSTWDGNKNNLYWVQDVSSLVPSSPTIIELTDINTANQEDNPHLERIDANNLILLFDNHGAGDPDVQIYYSISNDNGSNWSVSQLLGADINSASASEDLQSHLYKDSSNNWWLYFSSNRGGSIEVYRSQHINNDLINDFDNWGTPVKVIGGGTVTGGLGTIEGVGEPTLTSNGDLYFVVVYCKNTGDQTLTDSCDIDPWIATKK